MEEEQTARIGAIRRFNRFYTNVLGLLDRYMLNSSFSFSEIRILYEIGQTGGCTAKDLIQGIKIDPGYLSRILSRFETKGLLHRTKSEEDGRLYYLSLTDKGREKLDELNEHSNSQLAQMLKDSTPEEQEKLVKGMAFIEAVLSGNKRPEEKISLRTGLRPGDAGEIIALHGRLYSEELGYNHEFEGYVCKTLYSFFERYNPEKDQFWFAQAGEKIVGAIAVVAHSDERAQLRWFILDPAIRGRGFGKQLLAKALDYCREKKFTTVFLDTTEDQKTAILMYTRAGFKVIEEKSGVLWGKRLVEQRFELKL